MTAPLLRVEGLEVRYGKLSAVRDLSLDVGAGSVVVMLGVNGAGKSSLLKAIAGIVPTTSGTISLEGDAIGGLPSHRRANLGLAYLPEGRGVFPSLSVEENILTAVRSRSDDEKAIAGAYEFFPQLGTRSKQRAGSLSGGEQQMLSLARCLAARPKILLLDELSLGLAPRIVEELFGKLAELRDTGVTILLVEQFAHAALTIADSAGLIVRGDLTRFGPAVELAKLAPDELADQFFGGSDA